MLVSVLTLNVEWQRRPLVMHRGSFHNFAATQHVPLHFPVPGDRVAVMRTGLNVHIQYIRDAVLRPRRWGRDGGGGGASSGGAGAASGELGAGGVSRQDSMHEPAPSGEVIKSENRNACNAVPSNGMVNGVTEADTGPADMDIDKAKGGAAAQHSAHVSTEDPRKPKAEAAAQHHKPPINCAAVTLTARMHATHAQQQNDMEGAQLGSTALDSARGQQAGSGEGGSTGAAVVLPPVPPPTPKQEAWLQEIERVDEVAQKFHPVELMTVAAVAYVPADIPEVVQR